MTDRETLDAMLRRRPGLDPKERGAIRSLLERLEAAEAEVEAGKIATGTPIPNETWVDAVSRLEAAECTDECVAVAEYDRVLEENERLQTQVATLKAADHDEIERLRAEGDERETEGFRNGWQTQQARIEAALADAKYAASRIGGSSAYAEVDRALQRMVKALKGEGERKQHPAADDMGRVHSVYDLGEGE